MTHYLYKSIKDEIRERNLFSVKDVSKIFHKTRLFIYRLVRENKIECTIIGTSSYAFTKKQVEKISLYFKGK